MYRLNKFGNNAARQLKHIETTVKTSIMEKTEVSKITYVRISLYYIMNYVQLKAKNVCDDFKRLERNLGEN